MTRDHGRHFGLVRGGRGRALRPVLQAGNSVACVWRARLPEQLGIFTVEPVLSRGARIMDSALALHGVNWIAALLRLLPERDPHAGLHAAAEFILERLENEALAPAFVARFELAVLAELGFGLDLETCAASGVRDDLVYVSPRSGRAVSRAAGEPWRDKLLTLPAFLRDERQAPLAIDVAAAFALTGYFLERDVFSARGVETPDSRRAFLAAASRGA